VYFTGVCPSKSSTEWLAFCEEPATWIVVVSAEAPGLVAGVAPPNPNTVEILLINAMIFSF
jgi:hypothetical protein